MKLRFLPAICAITYLLPLASVVLSKAPEIFLYSMIIALSSNIVTFVILGFNIKRVTGNRLALLACSIIAISYLIITSYFVWIVYVYGLNKIFLLIKLRLQEAFIPNYILLVIFLSLVFLGIGFSLLGTLLIRVENSKAIKYLGYVSIFGGMMIPTFIFTMIGLISIMISLILLSVFLRKDMQLSNINFALRKFIAIMLIVIILLSFTLNYPKFEKKK